MRVNENLARLFSNENWNNIPANSLKNNNLIKLEANLNPLIKSEAITVDKGNDYTLSLYTDWGRYYIYNGSGTHILSSDSIGHESLIIKKGNIIAKNMEYNSILLQLDTWSQRVDRKRTFKNVKLEKGSKATMWIPNKNDLDPSIQNLIRYGKFKEIKPL